MEANAGEYIRKYLQPSSSPIPRIRIWSIQFAAAVFLPNNPMFTNIVFKLGEAK